MILVEKLRIDAVQLAHTERKIAFRGLDKKMVMVCHEAIRMTDPIVPLVDVLDRVQEVFAVLVVFEYGLFLVATGCYVIDRTGIFYS